MLRIPSLLCSIGLALFASEAIVPDVPMPTPDPELSTQLRTLLNDMRLAPAVDTHKFAVSLVDVTDVNHPRYAGVNDNVMMYAASLPKIAIILTAFEKIHSGQLLYTPELRDMLTRVARYSSNVDASKALQMVGFDSIASTLQSAKYKLYDPNLNGGLWVGKAYGGPNDYWKRDPLHNLSHGATTYQTARFFTMLAQGRLVDRQASQEMLDIFSHPGVNHKFVKGLSGTSGVTIYRKSGTWQHWHADAALIEHNGRRYVAAALFDNPDGGKTLEKLIRGLDDLICGHSANQLALTR